jgi:hypothetical protein
VFPIWLTGCGGSDAPEVHLTPTSGVVKIDGSPAAGVSVLLTPKGETVGTGAWGVTDSQGMFVLKHQNQEEGIEPGVYIVHLSLMVDEAGNPVPPNTSPVAAGKRLQESIPPEWSDRTKDSPTNTVTIVENGNPLEFNVKTK